MTKNDVTLRTENERYGLPLDAHLSVLLRHIYGNREATYAAKDYLIDLLERKLAVATDALEAMTYSSCQGHKDHPLGSPVCPTRMSQHYAREALKNVKAVSNINLELSDD